MPESSKVTTLFLDVGGVLLTNGWDRKARHRAVEKFNLDEDEVNERHHLTFDTYEEGKLSLSDYMKRVVFYEPRDFSENDFRNFMFSQSEELPEMLNFMRKLKTQNGLNITAVSNEGKELTDHRIKTFNLHEIFDAFIASSFVHIRKPDVDIYKIALEISQVEPEQVAYLDDRHMFVEVASSLGINGIHHTGYESSKNELEKLGILLNDS